MLPAPRPTYTYKSVEPLSLILMKVVEDLDWDKLLIILHTRLDMEYSPENQVELHNQSASVKHNRNPSVFENFHILIKGRENTFANMYATLRWHSKYTNIFLAIQETAMITNKLQPEDNSSLDQNPGFTFGKSEPMDYGFESRLWLIAYIIVQIVVQETKLNQKSRCFSTSGIWCITSKIPCQFSRSRSNETSFWCRFFVNQFRAPPPLILGLRQRKSLRKMWRGVDIVSRTIV